MRCALIYCCCLLAVLSGHSVMGAPTESPSEEVRLNFQQLMETNSCPNCNLTGAVFTRIDLSEANLEGANLAGAQFYLANLAGTNLQNANLQGATLGGADLADADLRGANLTGAVIEGAYLVGAMMDGTVITRRPYIDEGGPDAGEMVYVDDEASSKNLPFTNTAYVAASQDTVKGDGVDGSAEQRPVNVEAEKPVQAREEKSLEQDSSRQDDMAAMQEALPGKSKKLVAMADAVVSQESQDVEENTVAAASQPAEIKHPELSSGEEMQEMVAVPAPQLQSKHVEEAEKAMPVDSVAGNQDEADVKTTENQIVAQNMQPQPEASVEKPDADQMVQAQETVAVKQVMDEHQDDSVPVEKAQTEPIPEPEQIIVLEKDTVVAQVAASDKKTVTPGTEVNELHTPPAIPVQQESVSGEEKTIMESPKSDVQDSVQEEILTPGQMQEQIKETAGPETNEMVQSEQAPVPEIVAGEEVNAADELKEMMVEKLLDDNNCVECDLSGVDLSGRHLDEADLERANLQGANLSGADLSETNLKGADLRNANLRDADLREADLYRANLNEADLTGARFEEALIDMVSSTGAIGANFEGALTDE